MEVLSDFLVYCQQYPSAVIVITFAVCYVIYYNLFVAKVPHLACKDEKFRRFLLEHCPAVTEKFKPTIWCFESRAQTIIGSLIKSSPTITYDSELVIMPDGGQIVLDWYENENEGYPDPKTRPTILLLPGLTGSSGENYILHYVHEAAKLGYRTVVFNNRGNGGAKLVTPRTYCAADTEDLQFIVSEIRQRYPDAPFIGVGISLGGMILFNYLAKTGEKCGLEAGMIVSVAWNVFESVIELEKPGINLHVINRKLARNLVENVKQNLKVFESHFDNIDDILKASTIREFDDRFTAKMFGYDSWEAYYKEACLHDKVHALKVPVLCLNAADDPFSPKHAVPLKEAEENDNIAIILTSRGGHIGFMEGLVPRHANYMDRVYSQYIKAIFTHGPNHLKQD